MEGRLWPAAAGVVLAAAAALFFGRLGDRGVTSEEVRWAEVAREMRASGDFLRPTFNGQIYFDKPVGSYWLVVAASYLTGGVDETAARLPAAAAGWAGVLLVMLLGRRLSGDAAGVLAGAVLATAWGFAFYARRATADAETTTGVLAAVWWYDRHRGRGGPWVVGLWLVMAVTSLTKGLLGFALPVAVLFTHATWEGLATRRGVVVAVRENRWLFTWWTLAGVPLAAAVYLAPFLLATDAGVADGLRLVWRENVRRFVDPHNHVGPVYLYVGVIFVLAAPWGAFLPAALVPPAGRGDRLAAAYFWAVFLFFTASASRRSYYLLPVLPAVALLVARVLTAPGETLRPVAKKLRTAGWGLFGVGVAAAGALLVPPAWVLPAPYNRLPEPPLRVAFAVGWFLGVAAVGWATVRPRFRPAAAAAVAFAGLGYVHWAALPAFDDSRTRRMFLAEVRAATAAAPDGLATFRARDAVFDLGRVAPDRTADELAAAVRAGRVRWVLARRRYVPTVGVPARMVLEEAVRPWDGPDQVGDKLVLLEAAPVRPE